MYKCVVGIGTIGTINITRYSFSFTMSHIVHANTQKIIIIVSTLKE